MTISPLPRRGTALEGRDQAGRVLRVAAHPQADRAVVSIWQGDTCRATVRLSTADLADLIAALAAILADTAQPDREIRGVS